MDVNPIAMRIINRLKAAGYEAFLVGGCIRDFVIGKEPKDWDICTSAKTDEILKVFKDYQVLPTGIKHGTVTLMIESEGFEVTTYRTDGEYSDGRHPDSVVFVDNLQEDLLRRDFTINAIAYDGSFKDPFNGIQDIHDKVIRCVGNPTQRFTEDKLRILRGLRFAAVLGFEIEANTLKAMQDLSKNLPEIISAERIQVELKKMICGKYIHKVLSNDGCAQVFFNVFPKFRPLYKFEQHSKHHKYDVWEHTLTAIDYADNEDFKLAALFHDIGKPDIFEIGENGEGHFLGHADISYEIATKILENLKFPTEQKTHILELVKYHHFEFPANRKSTIKAIRKLGKTGLEDVLKFRVVDVMAQSDYQRTEKLKWVEDVKEIAENLDVDDSVVFSLKELNINGKDLMEIGYTPGIHMGDALKALLQMVQDETIKNEKSLLISKAIEMKESSL